MEQKQPKVLKIYFLTEMWERCGFYVIQSLLIFYLINTLHLSDKLSYGILGSITALSYSNTVIGGYISDRLIGHRVAVLLAALMLSVGYGSLSAVDNINMIILALSFITMGVGLLVPSVRCMVGLLYDANDERRHSGFTFCYIGVNTGIIIGETVAGGIQHHFGWHSVFLSSSIVLLFCFFTFWLGTRYFRITNSIVIISKNKWLFTIFILLGAIILGYYVIQRQTIASIFFFLVAFLCLIYVVYAAYKAQNFMRKRFVAFLLLMLISTLYWAMYFQMFFSMNLFVERIVDRNFLGITLLPTTFPAIEACTVIVAGPFFVWAWRWLPRRYPRFNPTVFMKFSLALLIQCLAFGLLFLGSLMQNVNGLINPEWFIPPYILIGVGELLLMPISLAMVGELLPSSIMGVMIGIFLISLALGGKLAGWFANITDIPEAIGANIFAVAHIYQHSFFLYFIFSIVIAVMSLFLVPLLKKLVKTTDSQ
ncbi:MAG: peptide MFS transporter [Pseudomonadota bacterium]